MSLPKEPRQKMINVMYLVLTALLALNVSVEILNAFKTVDRSLNNSNTAIDEKDNTLFASFKEMLSKNETKDSAAIWFPKAKNAKDYSDDAINYIEDFKKQLIAASDPEPAKDGKEATYNYQNTDASTHLLVEGPVGEKNGEELLKKLTDYKDKMLGIDPEVASLQLPLDLSVPPSLNEKGAKQMPWAYTYFHMTPTVAAVTILDKFENDIKNSESQVVEFCHKKIGAVKIVYDKFQAIASQSSEYLMPGQELTITGGVGAFSSAAQPTVSVDGSSVPLGPDGTALYKTTVGGPGSYTKKVTITFKKPNGELATLDKEIKYTVGSPTGASVSADATKIFYIGLDNPVTVSGGTKGAEATTATIDNGTITKGTEPGKYSVRVTGGTSAIITVTVDGKSTPFNFRVKPIPDPVAMVGRSKGGKLSANEFKSQQGLRADLENFIFEGVKYNITSYTLYATGKGFTENPGIAQNNGAAFTPEARRIIDRCVNGTTVTFDDIKAVGPDGRTRSLPLIGFNLTN